jgi:hypothetical protein
LKLATSHTAGSHLSSPSGESSKTVPTLTEYCFLQPFAFPHTATGEVGVLDGAAAGTHGTFGPAQVSYELGTDIEVGEIADRLDEAGGK